MEIVTMPDAGPSPLGGKRAEVHATLWKRGTEPRMYDLQNGVPPDGVIWVDVCGLHSNDDLLSLLTPSCPGLRSEMLDDLLDPDQDPVHCSWADRKVRLASTFAAYPGTEGNEIDWGRKVPASAKALYQPVELLACSGWLVTRWHEARVFCGSEPEGACIEPVGKREVAAAVTRCWAEKDGGDLAGDLGVLIMHELALTYAPTHRHFRAALEEWELDLYGVETDLRKPATQGDLTALWGARARLRDWLGPLNVSGLNWDIDKAWLPVSDHAEVKAVDKRVDDALDELSDLGDTLRSSFQLLHVKVSEAHRDHHEQMQRRVEFIAAGFLVPTLIVGFFGANTWVPGEHRHWGLTLMLIAMAVFTCAVVATLVLTYRRLTSKRSAGLGPSPTLTR